MKQYNTCDIEHSKKFNGHASASAWIVKLSRNGETAVGLRSYNTIVAWIDTDGNVTVTGLYSATTIKHLGWFAHAIGCTYYDLKRAYLNGCVYNQITGDYIDPRTGEVLYSPDIDGKEYKVPNFKVA